MSVPPFLVKYGYRVILKEAGMPDRKAGKQTGYRCPVNSPGTHGPTRFRLASKDLDTKNNLR
jgi:hypothetical protein